MMIKLQKALGVALRPLMFAAYFLSGLVPRAPDRWVFGSWSGRRFADNAAALFEHVESLDDSCINAVWISLDRQIIRDLRKRGFDARSPWSPRGIAACLTAGVYVFDGLTKDINHWLSRGAKTVLLRHGIGIKKVERAIEQPQHRLHQLFHGSRWQRAFWSYLLPWHLVRPDMMIAASPEHATQGQTYYGVGPERVEITGFPRNDRLMTAHTSPLDTGTHRLVAEARERRLPVYLYLPTFRDDDSRFDFPLRELDAMASRLGVMIAVKLHFVDGQRNKSFVPDPDGNLRMIDANLDANTLFGIAEGLVSDYSSVVFDFILTEKPVVFFVPDLDQYRQHSRSLYYDFEEVTPGPKARSIEELEAAIHAALKHGLGHWRGRYEDMLTRFHTYRDARSSERTYGAIVTRFLPAASRNADGSLTKSAVN